MLDEESGYGTTAAAALWDGDLEHFSMRATSDDSDLAAMVVVRKDGSAAGWLNLRHVHPDGWPWVWMKLRNTAARRGVAVLLVEELCDLAALVGGDEARGN